MPPKNGFLIDVFLIFALFGAATVQAALDVAVASTKWHLRLGEGAELLIAVANTDGFSRTDVDVEFIMPAGFSSNALFATPTLNQGSGNLTIGNTVGWNISQLSPGEVRHLRIFISAISGAGSLINGDSSNFSVNASDSASTVDPVNKIMTVDFDHGLDFAATIETTGAAQDEPFQLVLVYGNRSVLPKNSVELSFELPNDFMLVDSTVTPTQNIDTLTWDIGTLDPGSAGQVHLRMKSVAAFPSGTLLPLEISATSSDESQTFETVLTPGTVERLQMTLSHSSFPLDTSGDNADLTIALVNNASFEQSALEVRFINPSFLTGDDSFTDTSLSVGFQNFTPGEVAGWDFPSLAARQPTLVRIQFRPSSTASGTVVSLVFTVRSSIGAEAVSSLAIPIVANPALDVEIASDNGSLTPGGDRQFTLSVGNRTAALFTSVSPRLVFPSDLLTNIQLLGGSATLSGDLLTWDSFALSPSAVEKFVFTARVTDGITVATVAGEGLAKLIHANFKDDNDGSSMATASYTQIFQVSQLVDVALCADRHQAENTGFFRAQLVVTNRAAFTLSDLELDILLPEGMEGSTAFILPSVTRGFTSLIPGELVGWSIASLPPGQTQFFQMRLNTENAAGITPGSIIPLKANVRNSTAFDFSQLNISIPVATDANLSLAADRSPQVPGGVTRFKLTYGNRGTLPLNSSSLRVELPRGLEFLFGDDSLVHSSDIIFPNENGGTINVLDNVVIAPLSFDEVIFYAKVSDDADPGDIYPVEATLTGSGGIATSGVNLAVESDDQLRVAIVSNGQPVVPDQWTEILCAVGNSGASSLNDINLQFLFPEGAAGTQSATIPAVDFGFTSLAPGEITGWNITLLPAGGVRYFRLLLEKASAASPDGETWPLLVRTSEGDGLQVRSAFNQKFQNDPGLDIAITADRYASLPEETINLEIAVGNRSLTAFGQTMLRVDFPGDLLDVITPPDGDPPVVGNAMRWEIDGLSPGQTSVIPVSLKWRPGVSAGTLASICAHLKNGITNHAMAGIILGIHTPAEHELAVGFSADIDNVVDQAEPVLTATADNNGSIDRTDVIIDYFVPQGFSGSAGDASPSLDFGFSSLVANEIVGWEFADFTASSNQALVLPLTFSSSVAHRPGSIVPGSVGVRDSTDANNLSSFSFRVDSSDVSFTGVDPNSPPNPNDSDGDGVFDVYETGTGFYISPFDTGTNPNNNDTDGDGIKDGDEIATSFLNPVRDDSDFIAFFDARTRIMALSRPLLVRDPESGEFTLKVGLRETESLLNPFQSLPLAPSDISVTEGLIEIIFTPDGDTMFYQVFGNE